MNSYPNWELSVQHKCFSTTKTENSLEVKIEEELHNLKPYVQERFRKVKTQILKQMNDQISKLESIWKNEKDNIDLTGLKEIKFEFDQVDRNIKQTINDWDKRRHSDILSDYLLDLHDKLYYEYFVTYTAKADLKRSEAVIERQREKELLLYKNEKRRSIPTSDGKMSQSSLRIRV